MTRRSYGQSCGIARALDLLGERWTLLVIRDLLVAPRRYSDLIDALPGIGTNLLADRLRRLEEEGVIRRRTLDPPDEHVTVYEPTEAGRELEPVLHQLVRWSWAHLGSAPDDHASDPRWTVLALRARVDPQAAAGVRESYQLEIDDHVLFARVDDGRVHTGEGAADDPAVILRTGDDTLSDLAGGRTTVEEARSRGLLELEGRPEALERFFRIFARDRN